MTTLLMLMVGGALAAWQFAGSWRFRGKHAYRGETAGLFQTEGEVRSA
ncbi:MAG: hypothetical protein U0936_02395 [Planctomycetaceae bacterium]